jgi:choline dehydrogenase-like flavoprotein
MPELPERADVVIVGSGPTGATYARLIADARPTAKVLMVEAGPAVTDPPGMHLANIGPQERERAQIASQGPNHYRYPLATMSAIAHNAAGAERARALVTRPGLFQVGMGDIGGDGFPAAQESCNVGGMGALWFGACPRPGDQERIDFIDPDVLDEALTAADGLLQVSNTQFLGSGFAKHVERVIGDVLNKGRAPGRRVQPMPMAVALTPSGVRRFGPDVIFGTLLKGRNPHFELRPETLCEQILMAEGRVTGVRLRDRATGTVTAVSAAYVVVAGDSFRTPQLLFASGIRPKALGRYLNEHPQVSIMAEVEGFGTDTGHVRTTGDTTAMSDSTAITVASSGVTWLPYDGEIFPFHGMLARINPDTVPRSMDDRRERKPVISVHLFTTQELRFDNRLEFSETDKDWIGMPAMTIHHTLSDEDRATLKRGETEVLRLSHILGKPVDGEVPWVLPSGSSLHYQGTVRMGTADDGSSVCDATSRVWGTENLYVAGNGVIPTRTACNPTLTSVALSVIGARDIVNRLEADAIGRDGAQPSPHLSMSA